MRGIRLGSVMGFEIRVDYSWFIIAFLILWSFSAGVFPERVPGLTPAAYLAMGTVGAILFFGSLLAHELSHSVVARRRGVPVAGITLFVFGGMAHTQREAETPTDELVIAGVGPLCSLVIGGALLTIGWLAAGMAWLPPAVVEVATYLGFLNVALAVFNLLPGFPLDGGRLFRALAWRFTGDLRRATRWASDGGKGLGYLLMGLGAMEVMAGVVGSGLWLVFIGWFLRTAAVASFDQLVMQELLSGARAADVMTPHPSTVSPWLALSSLVDERLLVEPFQAYPVVEGRRPVGMVTLAHVKATPRERWPQTTVSEVMDPAAPLTVSARAPLTEVLETMTSAAANRVLVVDGEGSLVGIVSASDVARWIHKQQALAEPTVDERSTVGASGRGVPW